MLSGLHLLQVGIVGLPNVGKSTLFNTLTKMGIPAENFPFCTIDPNNVGHDVEGCSKPQLHEHALMHRKHRIHESML